MESETLAFLKPQQASWQEALDTSRRLAYTSTTTMVRQVGNYIWWTIYIHAAPSHSQDYKYLYIHKTTSTYNIILVNITMNIYAILHISSPEAIWNHSETYFILCKYYSKFWLELFFKVCIAVKLCVFMSFFLIVC